MNKLLITGCLLATAFAAVAMPNKKDLAAAQKRIEDVIAPDVKALNAGRKTVKDVADVQMKLAADAQSEAEKYLLLQSAFKLYSRGEEFDSAAKALTAITRDVKDIPPELITELVDKEFNRDMGLKAPKEIEAAVRNAERLEWAGVERKMRETNRVVQNRRIMSMQKKWENPRTVKEVETNASLKKEIGRLLKSAQPRRKITMPHVDSAMELPVFTDPAEAQRKAKKLGLWMFVYNTPGVRKDEFPKSPSFLEFLSKHCILITVKDFGREFSKCPWERTGVWPCCRILDSDGRLVSPIAKWSGMGNCAVSGEKMAEIFKGFIKACEIMPAAFDAIEHNPDETGLARLHRALSALPESFVKIAYSEWAALLVKEDRSGTRGWSSCYPYAQQAAPIDGYTWPFKVENGEATIGSERSGPGCRISPNPTGNLCIPSTLGGAPVTRIGWFALVDCKDITSVSIPSSVTDISKRAFARCKRLTSFLVDPDNPSYSSRDGFLCSKNGTTLIAGLNGDVTIPSCVTCIDDEAFFQCEGVTSVTIPASVRMIGEKAFEQCNRLTSFSVDANNSAYSSKEGLLCTKDGSTLVAGLNGDVTIPSCVKTIGDNAFAGRSRLTSVTIPQSVTSIGRSAFFWCTKLRSVKIPSSVTSIGANAFEWCYGLADITVDDHNASYCSDGGVLYNKAKTELLHVPREKRGAVVIPSGVTHIAANMFSGCSEVPSVTIPDSVTKIGRGTFSYCRGLTSVTMQGECPDVGGKIFDNCDKLTAIHVPANAKSWAGMTEWQGIPLVFDAK